MYPKNNRTIRHIRVLLVDDHAVFRQQVKELIAAESGIEVVGEATDGLEAITKARELKPDLVLMDVRLPGQNGLEATRQLKDEMPKVKVIILTLFDLPIYRDTALANGASDYVIKKAMFKELLPAIQRVMYTDHPECCSRQA
ncbi:MAG: response regulator transcription factor [Anaerolineae bacterium]|nr:response regulator transcription factor [Anaerolineae bacterium]